MPTAERRRTVARDPGEAHRASTPLEPLVDLVLVVAVGSASVQLHHLLAEGRVAEGLVASLTLFLAVWCGRGSSPAARSSSSRRCGGSPSTPSSTGR